ncbi:hypothetical protein M8818_004263 [Zalaria obscura]|uniref:Uncharacterized protein n=1 Tax=Zalaria obscura TaxID=2024903 RepID=A0ACC3SE42_9PEZI
MQSTNQLVEETWYESNSLEVSGRVRHTREPLSPYMRRAFVLPEVYGYGICHRKRHNARQMYNRVNRKRKHLLSTASSQSQSQSVAPSKLHNNDPSFTTSLFDREGSARSDASGDYAGDIGDCPLLPIHPQGLHSIKSISKVHVRVEFNPGKGFWEMHVKGKNGAWHDNDHLSKGAVQKLQHGSVIQIVDLPIIFKLPDNARGEGEVGEEEEYLSDSPLSDIGSSPEPERRRKVKADDSSSGSDEDQPLRIKIKKKPKKRHIVKLKLPKRTESLESTPAVAPERPSTSSKQPAKTVQPPQTPIKPDPATATAPVTTTEQAPDQQRRPSEITTPVTPAAAIETGALSQLAESVTPSAVPAADLPPGSILAGLAPEEIPQKRKGPGRPPKNGVMSKRDEAIIKRKKKELQKLGKEIPPLTELLAMARAEAGTKKDTKPEDGKEEDQAKQSIEIDPLLMAQNPSGTPNGEIRTDANGQQQSQPSPYGTPYGQPSALPNGIRPPGGPPPAKPDPPTAPAPAPAPVPPAPVSAPMPPTQAPAPAPPAPAPVAPIAGPASSQTPAPVPAPASVAVPVSSPAPAPAPAPAAPAQTPAGLTPIPAPATGASQPASASISAAPAAAGTKRALSPDSDGGDADEAKKQKVEGNA